MTESSGTSSLDAKLIASLGQAYEIREILKEDVFILPQFNISSSKVVANANNKRISLYSNIISQGGHKKYNFSIVYAIPTLRDKILDFLGSDNSCAFRVVLGFRDGVNYEHKSVSDRLDHMLDSGLANRREDIEDAVESKKAAIEAFRTDYIKRLLHFRSLGAAVREVQMDVVRLTQFLLDPNSSDRLRLESLAATLQLARQALVAEDVVLSRNAYMAKYAELSKSYLYKGLQCLQDLKQRCAESDQLRQELFQQSCAFLEEMMENRVKKAEKDSASSSSSSSSSVKFNNPSVAEHPNSADSIIQKFQPSAESLLSTISADIVEWKKKNVPVAAAKGKRATAAAIAAAPRSSMLLQEGANKGKRQEAIKKEKESSSNDNRDDILHDYALWVASKQQQFQNQVSQSMSKCIKMTLNALENRFMRISKSQSDGSSANSPVKTKPSSSSSKSRESNDSSTALEMVCDHWSHAKNLMWQIKERETELTGAKKHFESLRQSVTDEVRDRLQAIHNLELQQHMSTISRVQTRLKSAKDKLKKKQVGIEVYQSLTI